MHYGQRAKCAQQEWIWGECQRLKEIAGMPSSSALLWHYKGIRHPWSPCLILSSFQNCWEDCSMPNETMSNTSHVSSDVYCYEPFDEDFWPTVDANKYWIQGWFLLIVACIGSIGNILTIVVLKNFDNKSSFNSLLIGLMSLDSVLLLFAIYDWSLLDGFGRKEPEWHIYLFPYLIHPLKSMTGTACVYMVVAVAAER